MLMPAQVSIRIILSGPRANASRSDHLPRRRCRARFHELLDQHARGIGLSGNFGTSSTGGMGRASRLRAVETWWTCGRRKDRPRQEGLERGLVSWQTVADRGSL